jgi:hypothetical protein
LQKFLGVRFDLPERSGFLEDGSPRINGED